MPADEQQEPFAAVEVFATPDESPVGRLRDITHKSTWLAAALTAISTNTQSMTYLRPWLGLSLQEVTLSFTMSTVAERQDKVRETQETLEALRTLSADNGDAVAELIRSDSRFAPWVKAINDARKVMPREVASVFDRTALGAALDQARKQEQGISGPDL
jgi:hypothetical protein